MTICKTKTYSVQHGSVYAMGTITDGKFSNASVGRTSNGTNTHIPLPTLLDVENALTALSEIRLALAAEAGLLNVEVAPPAAHRVA